MEANSIREATDNSANDESIEIDSLLEVLKDWVEGRPLTETSKFVQGIVATLKKEGMLRLANETEEVSPQTAGELLGVSRPHVYRLLDEGTIPFRRVGNRRRIRLADLKDYGALLEESRRDLAEIFGNTSAEREALIKDRAERLRRGTTK